MIEVYVVSKDTVLKHDWTGGNLVSKDRVSEHDRVKRVSKDNASLPHGRPSGEQGCNVRTGPTSNLVSGGSNARHDPIGRQGPDART